MASDNSTPAFDTQDSSHVKHDRVGLWDLYVQETPKAQWLWPGVALWRYIQQLWKDGAYVHKLFLFLISDPRQFILDLLINLLGEVVFRTFRLWLSAQLLDVMTAAFDNRPPEETWFLFLLFGKPAARVLGGFVQDFHDALDDATSKRLQRHFTRRLITARARLDVPTFKDSTVASQLQAADLEASSNPPYERLRKVISSVFLALVALTSSFVVLALVVVKYNDMYALVLAAFLPPLLHMAYMMISWESRSSFVWAATCRDSRYIKWKGLCATVALDKHRQEVVVGNLNPYVNREADNLERELGNDAVTDFDRHEFSFWLRRKARYSLRALLLDALNEIPELVLAVLVVNNPSHMPLLLASWTVIQQATKGVISEMWTMFYLGETFAECSYDLKGLYELANVENKIVDGNVPFPENRQDTAAKGVSIEFRNVSFKYPDTNVYALRDVSFTIQRGELAVIVGFNGSGKSTILKLITRVFDPSDGAIFIDGADIKTLKLFDLRESIACLFQDYSILPLSIGLNIGLGWPESADDDDAIQAAARLAEIDFEDRLGEGFESYLEHPVQDHYANLPEGTTTIFGQKVDFKGVRTGMSANRNISLSGGQTQKIAVARALMRTTCGNDRVGLMLFDEPSAHMDPVAEYSLFKTLRELRGGKTMIFSSHRYGNLTRHAGVIFYMKEGRILERGTQEELIALGGGYAEMWKLQAEAFTS
ncbi:P-loop containing nucleoside triphosphate hydrolase protein [Exidia glandulosa HHB12029]|uniref:p-loop containing nucleoside triphosphate hydrolase protein n=1 Tax=Exidia glandulosa HHB12029 TaxID=1314781 RepID=A0A165PLU4_EXIGL|nr:P-loop containing nucleoside triphosphate hydrolase protein [Exidia glandulosa HHB12029]